MLPGRIRHRELLDTLHGPDTDDHAAGSEVALRIDCRNAPLLT